MGCEFGLNQKKRAVEGGNPFVEDSKVDAEKDRL